MSIANRAFAEIASVLAFVASVLAVAMRGFSTGNPGDGAGTGASLPGMPGRAVGVLQQPVNTVLWSLLVIVVAAAILYLVLRWRDRFSGPRPVGVVAGLSAAALWPWLPESMALGAAGLAVLAPVFLLGGLINQGRRDGIDLGDFPLAAVAGWLIMTAAGALALPVERLPGVSYDIARLVGLVVVTLAIVRAQLLLGERISCALVGIWSLIGIAAASFDGSMTVAMACVLGIAAMAVVVVRVTT